jgi:D-tyrosyl-tRNA(Tyr) deacylase
MRALVQRVTSASVRVEDAVVADIGRGLCVLLGIAAGDLATDADRLAQRVANLRVFEREDGRLDRSLLDIGGEALVVSQFTLIADTAKGNRPSFTSAARPESAEPLYRGFCAALAREGVGHVATGRFGANMLVEIANQGPVTIVIDT